MQRLRQRKNYLRRIRENKKEGMGKAKMDTIVEWDNAEKLVCPYLRYTNSHWVALHENPCGKHPENPICKGFAESSKDKIIIIQKKGG